MSTEIERRIHHGRTLCGHEEEHDERVAGWPEVAYGSLRAINHLTHSPAPIPAPVLYDVLGNLAGVGNALPQALGQLADGLTRSLAQFDVTEARPGADPQDNVRRAVAAMRAAAEHAEHLGSLLEEAQSAIAGQDATTPTPEATTARPPHHGLHEVD